MTAEPAAIDGQSKRPSTVSAEGPGDEGVLAELFALDGVEAQMSTSDAGARRDGRLLVAIGVIVGITANVATVADKIVAWRGRRTAARDARPVNVVLEDARGNRLALDEATPEQIEAAVETLAC